MSPAMSPPRLFLLLLLALLLFSGEGSATIIGVVGTTSRMLNRARKARQATEFLYAHNSARGDNDMPPLRWDMGLTRFAYKWAKQRQTDCKMIHSGGPYGENMFWSRGMIWSPARIVAEWAEERSYYDPKSNSCAAGEMCGHYTQIIWRTTTAVGCATVKCDNDGGYLSVCEYDPPGNYEGETPFDATLVKKP